MCFCNLWTMLGKARLFKSNSLISIDGLLRRCLNLSLLISKVLKFRTKKYKDVVNTKNNVFFCRSATSIMCWLLNRWQTMVDTSLKCFKGIRPLKDRFLIKAKTINNHINDRLNMNYIFGHKVLNKCHIMSFAVDSYVLCYSVWYFFHIHNVHLRQTHHRGPIYSWNEW